VISESFTVSLLTAVLLKIALELVLLLKGRIITRFHASTTPAGKAAAGVALWWSRRAASCSCWGCGTCQGIEASWS
jgi:hypothetical protein